ncbi:hypothetical protein SELMODRAFT_420005 [Selaginella moellendorffii]|uniref:Uncharacterized protein n=1 Tax=Selaginella moellendorffii TaxID=88036 RepID=D8SA91_SELML|nr:hypothetical protein SELMODRAFT_420005 [Selaginella moellendorffii]
MGSTVQAAGGEVGVLFTRNSKAAVAVLDRENHPWTWKEVATLEGDFCYWDFRKCCTHGNLTFAVLGSRVAVFDSRSVTWEWLEEGCYTKCRLDDRALVVELDFAAVANVNTPSKEMREACASKYRGAWLAPRFCSSFSELTYFSRDSTEKCFSGGLLCQIPLMKIFIIVNDTQMKGFCRHGQGLELKGTCENVLELLSWV